MVSLSGEDKNWLAREHPMLRTQETSTVSIAGQLRFDMVFDRSAGLYIFDPDEKHADSPDRIRDHYEVEIIIDEKYVLPLVRETSGRILRVAKTKNKSKADLHLYPDDTSCLCVPFGSSMYLPKRSNIRDFFYGLLVPYFYAQSHYETRNSWPWGEYSHSSLGLLEWYEEYYTLNRGQPPISLLATIAKLPQWSEYQSILKVPGNVQGHRCCVCGSKNQFKECHRNAFRGLWKLKKEFGPKGLSIALKLIEQ